MSARVSPLPRRGEGKGEGREAWRRGCSAELRANPSPPPSPRLGRGGCFSLAVAIAVLLVGVGAEARSPKKRAREELGGGKVTFVTTDRAFLDRGTADGVAAGQ